MTQANLEKNFGQFSFDIKDMPKEIGRDKLLFPFRFDKFDYKNCDLCKSFFTIGEKFPEDANYARICGPCKQKSPMPKNLLDKMRKYIQGRNASDTNRCLSCSNAVGHCNHSFGYYRFCPKCVMLNDKTCPCPTCFNVKAAQRRRLSNLWKKR